MYLVSSLDPEKDLVHTNCACVQLYPELGYIVNFRKTLHKPLKCTYVISRSTSLATIAKNRYVAWYVCRSKTKLELSVTAIMRLAVKSQTHYVLGMIYKTFYGTHIEKVAHMHTVCTMPSILPRGPGDVALDLPYSFPCLSSVTDE